MKLAMSNSGSKRGLYIHVPFCRKKCGYCDFVSYQGRETEIDSYLAALRREADFYTDIAGTFDTVYIGGGTPSLLSPRQLETLCGIIGGLTRNDGIREFTVEANPESMTVEKAAVLKSCGVDRISMGLQSHKPDLLRRLGRITTPKDFTAAWDILRSAGFKNINADLMTGLPGQSLRDFRESMDFLTAMNPDHISLYPLEIHQETPLGREGIEENPDEATDMYDEACSFLPQKGYEKYEISNFSKPGMESRHNMHYWLQEEYLGLGPGAASYIDGERRTTDGSIDSWIKALSAGRKPESISRETLQGREKLAEKVILGLRLTKGIEIDSDIIIKLEKGLCSDAAKELLVYDGNHIRIRPGKEYLANRLFIEFL